jgi:hypothetical protein
MNKNNTLLGRLNAGQSQGEAVLGFLSSGYQFTIDEAQEVGISDPRRVINALRAEGWPIYHNVRTLPTGVKVKRYRMGSYTRGERFLILSTLLPQTKAVEAFLQAGNEFSIEEAQEAGIADPRRVVNTLRSAGLPIYLNPRKLPCGTQTRRYRLGSPKTSV